MAKSVDSLDEKILKLQKATRSDFPMLTKWHVEACRRFPLYYEWHKSPLAESIHWMIFTLIVLYTLYFVYRLQVLGIVIF